MQPGNVDMDLIREAIMRRMRTGGGSPAGGGGMPMASQQTMQSGGTPTGAPATQRPTVPGAMAPDTSSITNMADPTAASKAAGNANTPLFDDDTRTLAKTLIARLLKAV